MDDGSWLGWSWYFRVRIVSFSSTSRANAGTPSKTRNRPYLKEEVELARWQEVPIAPNGKGAVVVGTERAPERLGCPCTLKLWEAGGPRTVTLGNVTFPVSQQAAP
jgi:hypothetical protein